ncbi:MAG: hypothetical protein Q6J44_01275 [Gloeomargarita sp. DG02_4_bins_56]
MGWWDELEASLSAKLDEFLQAHPDLAAAMEEDTLAEQENQTRRLLRELRGQTQTLEKKIRETGEQIRLWHERLQLAQRSGRQDLVAAAQVRKDVLMAQGRQYWAELTVTQKRMQQLETLLTQIQSKQAQVKQKPASSTSVRTTSDAVDQKFKEMELELEFEKLKREMGRQ